MARSIRIEMAGGYYHVMARGNRREAIFPDDEDRRFFVKTLGEACGMTGWRVHAWVLMSNHYHLMIETPEPNLVAGMGWLQNTLTRRFNVRHRAWGRVFGDRYKAIVVEGGEGYYYRTLMDYIHLNPVRARLIKPRMGQSVMDFRWSSVAAGYALPPGKREKWLAVEAGLAAFDLTDTTAGRRGMVERLDLRAFEEAASRCGVPELPKEIDARCSNLRRGWYWGTQEFAERMLEAVGAGMNRAKARSYHSAAQRQAHDQAQAERWLSEGLEAAGLAGADLSSLKGSDPRKLALAGLLWKRTIVSQEWLAQRLSMRSAANVSQQLRRIDPQKLSQHIPAKLREFIEARK